MHKLPKKPDNSQLEKVGFKKYIKIEPVWAKPMDKSFKVDTKEGDNIRGNAGDYLCVGVDGEMWPIDKDIFERTYREMK